MSVKDRRTRAILLPRDSAFELVWVYESKTDLQRMNFIYINEKNDMISVYVSSIAQQY